MSAAATTPAPPDASAPLQRFTLWQRLLLWLITWAGFLVIRVLGPTLRLAISVEDGGPPSLDTRPMVVSFWHDCIFPATYIWSNRQIRVLSSDSFDGEYTGRIIRKFGFVKVRGSSSRGAVRALLGMRREIERGATVAFTIDGPKGPRHVAKPGPVLLASSTGAPMVTFHIAVEKAWILNTWDRSMIPKPFSRALMRISTQVKVPPHSGEAHREAYLGELQASLERVRAFAEANVSKVGSPEFPLR